MKMSNVARNVDQINLSYAQLESIEQQGSSAFYFLDLEKLKRNYEELRQAFVDEYENCQIAYSFKTNYAPRICETLKYLGCWAEVVSEMEYEIATTRVGFKSQKIIVNGPLHEPDFIERALLDGALINVDAWYLLDKVAQICHQHPEQQFRIGIRLNYTIKEGGISRFGIESTPQNLQRLADWEQSVSNCSIKGFHSHFSNSSRSLVSFESRILGLLNASKRYFSEEPPHFINIGGGFFGDMPLQLSSQYSETCGGVTPDFKAYAKQITGPLKKHFLPDNNVTLFLEPGTALIANAMVFVCKVYDVKMVKGKTLALVNGSNHNVNHKWQGESLPIQIINKKGTKIPQGHTENFDIVGNTCIEKDVLCTDISGQINEGDYIIFEYMGGYSNVLKQPFIHPCQPIYAMHKGELTVVKRQETVTDILNTYN